MPSRSIGALRERLILQQNAPVALSVTSLTRSGTTATAVTSTAHGFVSGDWATIAGASLVGFNGNVKVTVVDTVTFTYPVSVALATPATGTITALYASDAQGGRKAGWRTLDTVWAELTPISASERLQAQAVKSLLSLRFRIRSRADLVPTMRALWTPSWPPSSQQQTLEISGIVPVEDGRTWTTLECGVVD